MKIIKIMILLKKLVYIFKLNNNKDCYNINIFQKIFLILFLFLILFNLKINIKYYFFEKGNKFSYCNNYGLLVYDYTYSLIKPNDFVNIGDYIQSLAALQYLPKNCIPILIGREAIQYYYGKKIKLILNGWFKIQEGNKFTSDQIEPLYISFHINDININDKNMINHLKKYQPIGCRDFHTFRLLLNYNINAYFSSCLTTTLDINYLKKKNMRNQEIIFVDFNFGYLPEADNFIKNMTSYNFSKITLLTHQYSTSLTHFERFLIADKLLKKYSNAKLLITTRIHAALPCLALRTPVILVNKIYDNLRYEGIYELLNTIGINSKNKLEVNVKINKYGLVINSEKFVKYSMKIKEFIKKNFN